MKEKRNVQAVLQYFVILTLMSISVTAFGVSSSYYKENPLIMNPGQTSEVAFTLQNMVGDEDMRVSVEVLGDKQYVELLGKLEYEVPAKTKDIPVKLRISVPKEMPLGTSFPVRVFFRSISKTGTQQVQLGTGIEKTFDVIVGEVTVPKKEYPSLRKPATSALIILVVVFIIWLLLRRKSKKNKKGEVQMITSDQNARW